MSETQTTTKSSAPPPHVPYSTFRNAIDYICESKPMPSHIDASVLRSFSGGARAALLPALRFLGLIRSDDAPEELLVSLCKATADEKKRIFKELLTTHYPKAVQNLSNGTPLSLRSVFDYDIKESVKGKCVKFFVEAAKDAGLSISPLIVSSKSAGIRVRQPTKRRSSGQRKEKVSPTPPIKHRTQTDEQLQDDEAVNSLRVLPFSVGMKVWKIAISDQYTAEEIRKFVALIKTSLLEENSQSQ